MVKDWPKKSLSYQDETQCGNLYTHIVVNDDGSIERVLLHLGKSGTCARASLSTLQELLTGILKTCTKSQLGMILVPAMGHMCGGLEQKCCSDVVLRRIREVIAKEDTSDDEEE